MATAPQCAICLAGSAVLALARNRPRRGPHGFTEIAGTTVGLLGSGGVLVFVVLLLRPYELGFSVKAGATYRALWDQGILEQPMVDIALAEAFEERRKQNAVIVGRLVLLLGLTLVALEMETVGLATAAALAS